MKQNATKLVISLLLILGLAACSSTPDVTYDEKQDFTPPKTFTFTDEKPLKYSASASNVNPFLEGYLMDAAKSQLQSKGYRFVDNANAADFAIAFTYGSRDKIDVNSYPGYAVHPGHVGHGRGGYWGGGYYGGTTARSYTEGQLSIDIFDQKSKKPAWHGTDSKKVTSKDKKQLREAADKAVASILAEFPPK